MLKEAFALSRAAQASDVLPLHTRCVGLDYLGDEWQYPHCPFALKEFLSFLASEREERHGAFGFRYHCGEADQSSPDYQIAHMGASAAVILRILKKCPPEEGTPPPLRIGHGILFRHFLYLKETPGFNDESPKGQLLNAIKEALASMRKFKVPVEVNLTSNHYLQQDASHVEILKNFLADDLVVVLATDNDGIWPSQYEVGGKDYVSVAGEFAGAIAGPLTQPDFPMSRHDVKTIIGFYQSARFEFPAMSL